MSVRLNPEYNPSKHFSYTNEDDVLEIVSNPSYADGFYFNKNNPTQDFFCKNTVNNIVYIGFDGVSVTKHGAHVYREGMFFFDETILGSSSIAERYLSEIVDVIDKSNWVLHRADYLIDGNCTLWYVKERDLCLMN